MNPSIRKDIYVGQEVRVVKKRDQLSGVLTSGRVARILTKSPRHPHGIKVKLQSGDVGRVQHIEQSGDD